MICKITSFRLDRAEESEEADDRGKEVGGNAERIFAEIRGSWHDPGHL